MKKIESCTAELVKAIQESSEYQEFCRVRDEVAKDPQKRERINQFRRHIFEVQNLSLIHILRQIRHALKKCDGTFTVYKEQGRIFVDCEGEYDYEETVGHLQHVFGIVGICPVMQAEDKGIEALGDDVLTFLKNVYDLEHQTFKVHTRRANKRYPIESMEVNAILGERILREFPGLKVL